MYIFFGVVGAGLMLFGFYRVSVGKWVGKSRWYELDNMLGALLASIYQFHYHVYISVVLNIIWAIVAFRGMLSYRERRRKHAR